MHTASFLLLCITAALLLILVRYLYAQRQSTVRERLFSLPLGDAQIQLIEANVALYRKLPERYRNVLHGYIQLFLHSKQFTGCEGLEVTEQMRLTIATNASMLLLSGKHQCFPGFTTLYIYPYTYQALQQSHQDQVATTHISHRAGESWYRGPVILSWEDVLRGSVNSEDGFNVVLHEFAHKLDEENALMDGLPVLNREADYASWHRVLSAEYQAFLSRVERADNPVIDAYGATSPVEFFAVITESFFEKPRQMQKHLPALYAELSKFYAVDPADW